MTQTPYSIWGGAAKVEISTNGSAWTDISGHANSVEPAETTRKTGEAYTFDGEFPIVKVGKRVPVTIKVKIVYTEQSLDAFEVARGQFEKTGGGTMYLRWSPAGGGNGEFQFTTDAGFVQAFQYQQVKADENGPLMGGFTIQCAQIIKSLVTS